MGPARTSTATLDRRAMIAVNSALALLAATARQLGPRASLRQAKLLLMVAMREPVGREAIAEAGGGSSKAALDDLHRLCATDRDGKPGLGLILMQPKSRDYRSVRYVLTARGRRAARQIATTIEALQDAGCDDAVHTDVQGDDVLTSGAGVFAEGALGNVSSAPPPNAAIEPEEAVKPQPCPQSQIRPRSQRRIADSKRTSSLRHFKYNGTVIRAVQCDGVVWFVAGDVCKCLGRDTSAGTAKALRYIGPDDRCVLAHTAVPAGFLGERCYEASGISLAGFLKLTRRTKGLEARKFEQWVNDRVLPRLPI